MVKDAVLALSLGVSVSISLRLLDIILGQQIILALAFLISAFVAGVAADYGGGAWAAFGATFFFPIIWASQLVTAETPLGWVVVVLFFVIVGVVAGLGGRSSVP